MLQHRKERDHAVGTARVARLGLERVRLVEAGFAARTSYQFHWQNHDYADFDAFLAQLTSRKRKQIRKERRQATASGVEILALTGAAIEPKHWDAFWTFYQDTGGNWVFVVTPDESSAVRREVRLGRRNARFIEVLDGLEAGEMVVTSPYTSFKDMDQLRLTDDL